MAGEAWVASGAEEEVESARASPFTQRSRESKVETERDDELSSFLYS